MIQISEGNIDRHIQRTIEYINDSDTGLKFACIAASPVVGSYDGTTQKIAKETRRSVSTIENWAHAHWLYKDLRSNGNRKLARQLWRKLPTSHWWKAWDIHNAGYDALFYLLAAYQYSWSGRGMMSEFDKDRNAGTAPLVFKRARHSLVGLVNEMLNKHNDHLSEGQRIALLGVYDEFTEER